MTKHTTTDQATQQYLSGNPLPAELAHMQTIVEQLPLPVIIAIVGVAVTHGLDDSIEQALKDAVAYQDQKRWRCAVCYRWQDRPNLSVLGILEDRLEFHSVCPECERRHGNSGDLADAMTPYVVNVGGGL